MRPDRFTARMRELETKTGSKAAPADGDAVALPISGLAIVFEPSPDGGICLRFPLGDLPVGREDEFRNKFLTANRLFTDDTGAAFSFRSGRNAVDIEKTLTAEDSSSVDSILAEASSFAALAGEWRETLDRLRAGHQLLEPYDRISTRRDDEAEMA